MCKEPSKLYDMIKKNAIKINKRKIQDPGGGHQEESAVYDSHHGHLPRKQAMMYSGAHLAVLVQHLYEHSMSHLTDD